MSTAYRMASIACRALAMPSATLGHLASLHEVKLLFRCWHCKRQPTFMAKDAAGVYGAETTLDEMKARIVCAKCGRHVDGDLVTFDIDTTANMYAEMEAQGLNVSGGFGHDRR